MIVKVQETRINLDHVQYYKSGTTERCPAIIFKMTNGNVIEALYSTKAERDEAFAGVR